MVLNHKLNPNLLIASLSWTRYAGFTSNFRIDNNGKKRPTGCQ